MGERIGGLNIRAEANHMALVRFRKVPWTLLQRSLLGGEILNNITFKHFGEGVSHFDGIHRREVLDSAERWNNVTVSPYVSP